MNFTLQIHCQNPRELLTVAEALDRQHSVGVSIPVHATPVHNAALPAPGQQHQHPQHQHQHSAGVQVAPTYQIPHVEAHSGSVHAASHNSAPFDGHYGATAAVPPSGGNPAPAQAQHMQPPSGSIDLATLKQAMTSALLDRASGLTAPQVYLWLERHPSVPGDVPPKRLEDLAPAYYGKFYHWLQTRSWTQPGA